MRRRRSGNETLSLIENNTSGVRIELKEGYLYDPVAQMQRKATDEEFVRQEMIKTLVNEYGYPLTSMATEFHVKLDQPLSHLYSLRGLYILPLRMPIWGK